MLFLCKSTVFESVKEKRLTVVTKTALSNDITIHKKNEKNNRIMKRVTNKLFNFRFKLTAVRVNMVVYNLNSTGRKTDSKIEGP